MLLQQDGEGIGLLAGGAAGAPDANRRARQLILKQLRDDLFLKRLEGLGITEEIGHADQQVTKQRLHLCWRLLQKPDVTFQHIDLVNRHPPFDATIDGAGLVLGKVMGGLGTQQDEYLFQRALGLGRIDGHRQPGLAEGVHGIGDEPRRHFVRRQFVVHQAGGNGAARHAVELGGFGILRHDHAALALDCAHALGSIASHARKHNADGPLTLVLGERTKEKVDW